MNSNLAIQTHSTPQWVLVKSHRSFFDQYDNDGNCIVSTKSEYSDDGAEWLAAHALASTGDDEADDYQKSYAMFSQASQGLQVSLGSPAISSAWLFTEVKGRTRAKGNDKTAALGDINSWYDAGAYVRSIVCPHYNQFSLSCNVYMFAGDLSDHSCNRIKGTHYWQLCDRAIQALQYARELDSPDIDAPVIGTAGPAAFGGVGYKRDVYIDEELKESEATRIANTLAQNILSVKSSKGFCKTIVLPYSPQYLPDGDILEVSHDWQNLQTSITFRAEGIIPDFLISQSVAAVADFVAARSIARSSTPQYGKVVDVDADNITVAIDNHNVICSSKLRYLANDDIVLVVFPAGNKLHGQIIARL